MKTLTNSVIRKSRNNLIKNKSTRKSFKKKPLGYTKTPFLKYSRLPRLDRKYCSCIMAVRHHQYKSKNNNMNPYGICIHNVYLNRGKQHNKNLDCGINYDLDNYNIEYLKSYAKERKIPLTYVNNIGKRVYYSKQTLISKLRKSIIDAKKRKSKIIS